MDTWRSVSCYIFLALIVTIYNYITIYDVDISSLISKKLIYFGADGLGLTFLAFLLLIGHVMSIVFYLLLSENDQSINDRSKTIKYKLSHVKL